ncbi:hypothetical protein AWZ03_002042 [Drosophila navojoa]|uniref:Uncharacterized protein n=1 Tax=Drosophila navojoa TaxID=7232 RepID=A0A484BTN8_DRONA|nr:hypothetical protein AWZ03_002042 [Drosophila navojoa]
MADDFSLDEIGFLLSPPHERSPNEMAPANGKLSKKRLLIGDLIANNDELVRRVKELEGQEQQLCSIKRTASEVTELYKQEKKQRIEFERRALEESGRCSDLEKQLDILKLNCEQLQEEAKLKSLPVDSKDIVIIFMQLALRIQEDSCSGGLTRAEYNMLRKLKDYCKSANISVPPSKSLMKKRAKILTATKATSTETLVTPTMPTMCSIGVQSERFVTTRDQSVQHKNTTTTRGTTTAALIETRTVGTCFPEPEPPLDAYQILEKMLGWNITPVSPLSDEPFVPEELPMISVGTNTDICDIHREIDYLPVLPAQLKRSDSRPPSRTMHDSVKDELTPPIDAATPDGYSHTMAKKLFNFIPHSQSVLDKMPPQDFEEIWQIVGQMLLVALQSRPANSISQTDFRDWFYSLYESHQTQNDAPCIDISNKETFMAPAGEELSPDDRNGSIETPPPEMGLELTPIRLTQFKEIEELNTTPKINEQNSCAQECKKKKKKKKKEKKKEKKQKKKKEQSIPTTPTETAVNFLTNLSDFHNSNCDNLDIQLNEEERELMQLASSTASNMLSSITSPVHKDFLSLSPVTDMSSSPIFDESLNVDKPQSMNAKPLGTRAAHIDFMALFGSDSDSADDQASANTKVVVDEVNADINSSNTEEEIPNGCDVRHKDTPPEPNSVINNSDLGCDSHHINKTNRLQRKRKLSSRNSSDTQSGTSEDGNIVTSDDHLHVDDTNNKRLGGFSESLSETRVEANPVTSDDHTHVDYTNNKRRRISYEFQSDAREENVVISDDYPHADDTSNRHKSLSESSEHSSVANDCQPYADDTNNIRGLSETRVEANNPYADYTNNTLSYEFQSDAREESEVTSDCYPHANDTSNRRKSLSESSEDSSVANDGQPYADDTNNIRGLSETRVEANNPYADYTNNTLSYESQSDAREENEVTSDGYPHADDTSNRRKSLCESSEETSVANDGQPYADDTSNRRKRSSYKSISESSEETSVSNDGDPQTDDIRNRLLSEPPPETRVEANSVTNDSHPNADYTNHTRGRISYESQPSAREEIVGTSDGHPHADDTSNRLGR